MKESMNEEAAAAFLDAADRASGINTVVEKDDLGDAKPNLGKISRIAENEVSDASLSPWKILNMEKLESRGMFYPKNTEILVRSAYAKEIRHWSTIDENDPIDVRECINWILGQCTKIKVKGTVRPLNFNDYLEIDKYKLLFEIHALTFPNEENKLWANIRCHDHSCRNVTRTHVTTKNMHGFRLPEELAKWYSEEHRCFVINSEKLGEPLMLYMPSIGISSKLRQKRQQEDARGTEPDKVFNIQGKYLFNDWRALSMEAIGKVKVDSMNWNETKFLAVHKICELLEKASINEVGSVCEKCKKLTDSHIFLGDSFTVKDIFIISVGLDEILGA